MSLMKHLEESKEKIERQVKGLNNLLDAPFPRRILPALIVLYMRQYGCTTDEAIKDIRKDLQNLKD